MDLLQVVQEENQIPTLFWLYEVATLLRAVVVGALVATLKCDPPINQSIWLGATMRYLNLIIKSDPQWYKFTIISPLI